MQLRIAQIHERTTQIHESDNSMMNNKYQTGTKRGGESVQAQKLFSNQFDCKHYKCLIDSNTGLK